MNLPMPRGRQADVIYFPGHGHQVVLGTAGTGKTTMAMLRAIHLADPRTANHGEVLLVTYNNTLVTYLKWLQPEASKNITIETYALFARGYLNSRDLMPRRHGIVDGRDYESLVEAAVKEVAEGQERRFFQRGTDFFADELEWISGMGIHSLAEYKKVDRIGRKTGLTETQREDVWDIRTEYLEQRESANYLYDWSDIASTVRAQLARDKSLRRYKHVIIDEGQDLSPEAVRSLVGACDPRGSVSFFGDYHQMIYGEGLSWRACGLNVQAVERFADNYRNTTEIARLAIAVSEMPHMAGDTDDLVVPKQPVAAGPLPTLAVCVNEAREIAVVRRQARDLARNGTVAILARTWDDARRVCAGLNARRLHKNLARWDVEPGIYYGCYHSAKGLEFDAVILPFCGDEHMPAAEKIEAFGRAGAMSREGKLLYVAITRARTDLLITYSGEITPLLPEDDRLYAKVSA